jgi:hypothetical protein
MSDEEAQGFRETDHLSDPAIDRRGKAASLHAYVYTVLLSLENIACHAVPQFKWKPYDSVLM